MTETLKVSRVRAATFFRRAQWRMLLVTMFCYLFYYTGRQNFGFAIPYLQQELGFSATTIGWIGGAMLLSYGFGQAINGNLGDVFGARRLMSLGAVLSAALNWVTSFGQSFAGVLVPWSMNGYVQSLGWAPGSRLIANWWSHDERGRAYGFYVFAAGFSSILTYGLSLFILSHMDWRWLFRLPVLLLLAGGIVFYLVARDRPESLGFAAVPDAEEIDRVSVGEAVATRYKQVLTHKGFLRACGAIGFESIARYGLLFWVPVYYLGENWKSDPASAWITLALPVGMALGALTAGYVSDRLFGANRSRPIALFLGLATAVSLLIYVVPPDAKLTGMILLFLAGFLVYGPQSSFWALCPDLLGRSRAGTGVGIMDACAYGFAAIGEVIIGRAVDVTGRTGSVFLVVAVVCALGAILILTVRK